MSHTQGPWKVLNPQKSTNYIITNNEKSLERVADSIGQKSDAHLIAAAPEMLNALELASHYLINDQNLSFKKIKIIVEKAISKARGES
jgi:hypothetical protein